jgi:hypothetical protein
MQKLNLLEQLINKKTEELIAEKQKRETLLANVLPKLMRLLLKARLIRSNTIL